MPFEIEIPIRTPSTGSMFISPYPHNITPMRAVVPNVGFDKIGAQVDNRTEAILNDAYQHAKSLYNYNVMTSVMQHIENLNQQAIQGQWTTQQYEEKLNDVVSNFNIDDPDLTAKINRYVELNKVDVISKLTQIQTKNHIEETLANTQQLINTLQKNITPNDIDSLKMSLVKWNLAIQESKDNKIFNSAYAQKLHDEGVSKLLNVYFSSSIQTDPQKFLQDLKSSVYDDVIQNPAQKQNLIRSAKRILKINSELQKQQQEQQIKNQVTSLIVGIATGKITPDDYSNIMNDSSIPDKVKVLVNKAMTTESPFSAFAYSGIYNNIIKNKYDNYNELQSDIVKAIEKGELNSNQAKTLLMLYDKVSVLNGSAQSASNLPYIDKNYFSSIPNIVSSKIKAFADNLNNLGSVGLPTKDIFNKAELSLKAKTIWLGLHEQYCKNGCNADMLNHITNLAVYKAIYKPTETLFLNNNDDFLVNLANVVGKNNVEPIVKAIVNNFILNDNFNIYNDVNLVQVFRNVYHDQPVKIPMSIPLKFENGNETTYKGFLIYDGNSVKVKIPALEKVNE